MGTPMQAARKEARVERPAYAHLGCPPQSRPQRAQRTCQRMYSMILCSPSPGTSWPAGQQGQNNEPGSGFQIMRVPGGMASACVSWHPARHADEHLRAPPMQTTVPLHSTHRVVLLQIQPTPAPSPLKMMVGFCQAGSSAIFLRMKKRMWAPSRAMKAAGAVWGRTRGSGWVRAPGCLTVWLHCSQLACEQLQHKQPQHPSAHVCRE